MKRLWLILIAMLLLILGASVCFGTLLAIDFNFYALEGVEWVEKVYTVEGDFSSVLLTLGADDLTVLPSEDGVCRFVCTETQKHTYDVKITDGTLHITEGDTFRWYDLFFSFTTPKSTLYLPNELYSLFIKTGSGDVTAPSTMTLAAVDITTGSGDVEIKGITCDSLQVTTGSGDVELDTLNTAALRLTTGSGEMEISSSTAQSIDLQTMSGSMSLSLINCDQIRTKSGSGSLDAVRLICGGALVMESGSGDISLEFCDAASLSFTTASGDVTGVLLSPKTFRVKSRSGKEIYPSTQGGLCEATTGSGDIEFFIRAS